MPGNIPMPPASVVASWPKPNYVDPEERTWLPPFAITLLAISTLMVLIRFVLRSRNQGGGLGADDALLLPAWLLAIGFTAYAVWSSDYGIISRHIWDVLPSHLAGDAFNFWFSTLIFLVGLGCLKISILLFYRRIHSDSYGSKWKFAIWASIGFILSYTTALVLVLLFGCHPIEAYWKAYDPTYTKPYHCADTTSLNLLASILSIVTDLIAVILPACMLQHLDIPRRQKIGLNIVFSLSLVSVAAAIGRAVAFHRFDSNDYDFSWIGFWVYFCTILEYQLGLICATAPSMRVFIKRYLRDNIRDFRSHHSPAVTLRTMTPADERQLFNSRTPRKAGTFTSEDSTISTHGETQSWSEAQMAQTWTTPLEPEPQTVREEKRIRTPQEYEDSVLEEIERSRRSLLMKSLPPRPPPDRALPPLPSMAKLEKAGPAAPRRSTQQREAT